MKKTFNWHHPAVQQYIAEAIALRSQWRLNERMNFNTQEDYYKALQNVRAYLDDLGMRMPRVKYEDKKIECLIYRK